MFPIRPVPDNDVKKPPMFVFADMEDYRTRGKNVDIEYAKILAEKKKCGGKSALTPLEPAAVIPPDIIGKRVKHKAYGTGTIKAINGSSSIDVAFEQVGLKKLGYEVCMENHLLEFV